MRAGLLKAESGARVRCQRVGNRKQNAEVPRIWYLRGVSAATEKRAAKFSWLFCDHGV